jgi:flagellar protein FlaG
MENNAKILAVPTAAPAPSSSTTGGDFDQGRAAQEAERAARYRLIIEEGPTRGSFIYKTLDSVTGEIVRQFPREQVLRMSENGGYATGGLIDTNA